ncbi:MAG: hypothetical protein ACI9OJ_004722 [Myxococcota bacterium]|jgi:hypothetical protein
MADKLHKGTSRQKCRVHMAPFDGPHGIANAFGHGGIGMKYTSLTSAGRNTLSGLAVLALCACGSAEVIDTTSEPSTNNGGKADSGWVGADTFEVDAVVRSQVSIAASTFSDWSSIEKDTELQAKLIDLQLKFIKTSAEAEGWRFNQLADSAVIERVETDGDVVTLHYSAIVDMLGRLDRKDPPALEDLDTPRFTALVPATPDGFDGATMRACSKTDAGHSVADYNFHYYFAPETAGCELQTVKAELEITKVFDRPITYPEYDQLLQQIDEKTYGFYAALVPNRGDKDPKSRFDTHAEMLERDLNLTGVDMEDGAFRRYTWQQEVPDGKVIVMIIDLYDPSELPWTTDFASSFRERLGAYTLVHYNGHSAYGSKHLLDEPESFTDAYQIITLHSCQSYAYYSRQVFRAKATDADPSGFALADIMATGKSSYPSGAPPTLEVLLSSLFAGMVAIAEGNPEDAPDWITITEAMANSTWGDIMYGMAGVRTNRWQPAL